MSDTPETDKAERMAFSQEYMVPTEFARRLERERDEALKIAEKLRKERFEARKLALAFHEDQTQLLMENAKLRELAERAIELVVQLNDGPCEREGAKLRAELDQLKEGGK